MTTAEDLRRAKALIDYAKTLCPQCGGTGEMETDHVPTLGACSLCGGSGKYRDAIALAEEDEG